MAEPTGGSTGPTSPPQGEVETSSTTNTKFIEGTLLLADSLAGAVTSSTESEANLANALSDYADRLDDTGRHKKALVAVKDCVKMFEALYNAVPATLPDDSDRKTLVFAAMHTIGQLYKVLHHAHPAKYGKGLVQVLNEHNKLLCKEGRDAEALPLIEESVRVYKTLYHARPEENEEALARILHCYSNQLRKNNQNDEALAAIRESVDIFKVLHQSHSTYHLQLADALRHRSSLVLEAGNVADSLDLIAENVQIFRDMYQADPLLHRLDLATALAHYSDVLATQGKPDQALAEIEEGVRVLKAFHNDQNRPEEDEEHLARALLLLSRRLSDTGKKQDALKAIEESVQMLRALNEQSSRRHAPHLAEALVALSQRLSEDDKQEIAKDAVEESVKIYWKLYETNHRLSNVGEHLRAMATAKQRVYVLKFLSNADSHHATKLAPKLAAALITYADHVLQAGDEDYARSLTSQGVEIYKDLHRSDPAKYRASLAQALLNYSSLLSEADDDNQAEALAAMEESIPILLSLHRARPEDHKKGLLQALYHAVHLLDPDGEYKDTSAERNSDKRSGSARGSKRRRF
ncbi:hypothetical protein OC861_001688 [Tilletia horrida]|nr:hypothetical protein OC861_001688 [Tilletia horrida]